MLFYPVSNPAKIKQRIIDAAKSKAHEADEEREAVNFSFIDASLVNEYMKAFLYVTLSFLVDNE